MTDALRFVVGVHLHQPVGNFDYVFAQHVRDVYRPFLEHAAAARLGPLTVHVSGPLFDWLEEHDAPFLDFLGRQVTDHGLELLLAGFDEPILTALPRADRLEQIGRMREYLRRRFGVTATGLWLTERVWEPELAGDLAEAQVKYVFVDDRHFLVTGFRREELHQPWRTEDQGRSVGVLPIDEQLRYMVPFRPPAESAAYLRRLHAQGHRLAVLADDGEKFGGWPGTKEWVYEKGWLDQFCHAIGELVHEGLVRVTSGAAALQELPSGGLAYLPSASYREMATWALPARLQRILAKLEHELGTEKLTDSYSPLVRGTHWRNFLVRYPEANRLHKAMLALSALSRSRGDPPAARRAIGRAQCNDAYWHGVFGGLYLPILRNALWRQLAIAEGVLRQGEPLAHEVIDLDLDGFEEIWVHSGHFSALVSPRRGGAVEFLTHFAAGENIADTLTRRREVYHHDEQPADHENRALLVERVLPGNQSADDLKSGRCRLLHSWARAALDVVQVRPGPAELCIELQGDGLHKSLSFTADGTLRVTYAWDAHRFEPSARFVTELSLIRDTALVLEPAGELARYPINTVAKSERGLEETLQGIAHVAMWPVQAGSASLVVPGVVGAEA